VGEVQARLSGSASDEDCHYIGEEWVIGGLRVEMV
jgi:hypothetical protein